MVEAVKSALLDCPCEIQVGIADLKVGREPVVLITLGLGSCVGVTLYDPVQKVGGLLHIMLPRMSDFTRGDAKPAKFADTGVPLLLKEVLKLGANRRFLQAKIAGGAQMFSGLDKGFLLDIGSRNVDSVRNALRDLGIKITAEDVGGKHGRTMMLYTATGRVVIKMLGTQTKEI
ncbi:MAG: chemotaxis protein CheD [Bacillota bacterium]